MTADERWREFGPELRRLRESRNESVRGLAKLLHYDAGALSRIETGQRRPQLDLIQQADEVLKAGGALLRRAIEAGAIEAGGFSASADTSMKFAQWATTDRVDQIEIGGLGYELARIATGYVHSSLRPLFHHLQQIRDDVWNLLQQRPHPNQARELYYLGGTAIVLLSHATQNAGDSMAAMKQAFAAEKLAEQADHAALRSWVAGTKALIAEWSGNSSRAIDFARSGQRFAPAGDQRVRLAALEARACARSGRASEARDALDRVRDSADQVRVGDDLADFGGILTFSPVKALYYAGSTYTLISDHDAAERCALEAIHAYETGPVEERSYGDEALARIDVAIARIVHNDLDGAEYALRPVLDLPAAQRIRQIGDGLRRVAVHLVNSRYAAAPAAQALNQEIAVFDTLRITQ